MNRKELLNLIQQYDFALQEASLYLNAYPNNKEALQYYHHYQASSKEAKEKYEKVYGPLTNRDNNANQWTYVNEPWPWIKEE